VNYAVKLVTNNVITTLIPLYETYTVDAVYFQFYKEIESYVTRYQTNSTGVFLLRVQKINH